MEFRVPELDDRESRMALDIGPDLGLRIPATPLGILDAEVVKKVLALLRRRQHLKAARPLRAQGAVRRRLTEHPPQLPPWTGPMTGLSLRLWRVGRLAPVEGGGTLAERGRAPDSSFQDYIGTELFSFLYDHAIPLIRRGDVCFCALYVH